ncbi:hypothetical protein BD289DRAFT_10582 [Coniella lustricola]|uniref:Uncharacterized protein n=1 Tax=Coniella lustricola TaxID=2025994 RepID=A0A2T3A4F8_9PEZI|nr:hypothetical protein BD289DRAFT_10582 [Coniella lustricola]
MSAMQVHTRELELKTSGGPEMGSKSKKKVQLDQYKYKHWVGGHLLAISPCSATYLLHRLPKVHDFLLSEGVNLSSRNSLLFRWYLQPPKWRPSAPPTGFLLQSSLSGSLLGSDFPSTVVGLLLAALLLLLLHLHMPLAESIPRTAPNPVYQTVRLHSWNWRHGSTRTWSPAMSLLYKHPEKPQSTRSTCAVKSPLQATWL